MERPYRVKHGRMVGILASVLSGGVLLLFMIPVFPSCLSAMEWIIVGAWTLAGLLFYLLSRRKSWASQGASRGERHGDR